MLPLFDATILHLITVESMKLVSVKPFYLNVTTAT